ncbi:hypothetical protein [Streptomyces sp. MP131-18]|uniref:hypothetical protein n=1 Tax=Streptomyces sp. MP131-18 TaxID=1857892 RepID=UPI00097C1E91|nr:hypothetical protein [Streptomyces sp. MP131-18]ONK09293.1 hypothetical protein STBA_71480 [Streptomyces sp. MP131-18]
MHEDERVDPTTWTTHDSDGQEVTLPSTIAEVRAALPAERRAEFEHEMETTPGQYLTMRLAMWALETVHGAIEEIDGEVERLRAGDFSHVTTTLPAEGEAG